MEVPWSGSVLGREDGWDAAREKAGDPDYPEGHGESRRAEGWYLMGNKTGRYKDPSLSSVMDTGDSRRSRGN